jgi:hypothetical protein
MAAMSNPRTRALIAAAVVALVAGAPAVHAAQTPAQKCQKEIDKAATKFTKKKLKTLLKCTNKQVKKGESPGSCIGTAGLQLKIKGKKCPDAVITGAPSTAGLGMTTCASRDATCAQIAVTTTASLAQCLTCTHSLELNCLVGRAFNVAPPSCP